MTVNNNNIKCTSTVSQLACFKYFVNKSQQSYINTFFFKEDKKINNELYPVISRLTDTTWRFLS